MGAVSPGTPARGMMGPFPGLEIPGTRIHIDLVMGMNPVARMVYPWAVAWALASLVVAPASGAREPPLARAPQAAVAPILPPGRQSLSDLLNAPSPQRKAFANPTGGALARFGQALVLKPDLGACQSFIDGCHEGAIVTMPHDHIIRTMGAGLGVRLGGVRVEYAYGPYIGANFLGIRTRIP